MRDAVLVKWNPVHKLTMKIICIESMHIILTVKMFC